MTFRWQRDGIAIISTCVLCGLANRSLSESVIYLGQRAHSWLDCQQRRAEMVRAAEPERCRNGHERAGNTRIDNRGDTVCLACRRDVYAAHRQEKEAS